MAGVLEMIRWPQKRSAAALGPFTRVNPKILELQAAKEILAEVFQVRISDVGEMILSRYIVHFEENSCSEDGEPWPKEFQLEGRDSQSPA
jgi:hypothetical protein